MRLLNVLQLFGPRGVVASVKLTLHLEGRSKYLCVKSPFFWLYVGKAKEIKKKNLSRYLSLGEVGCLLQTPNPKTLEKLSTSFRILDDFHI